MRDDVAGLGQGGGALKMPVRIVIELTAGERAAIDRSRGHRLTPAELQSYLSKLLEASVSQVVRKGRTGLKTDRLIKAGALEVGYPGLDPMAGVVPSRTLVRLVR